MPHVFATAAEDIKVWEGKDFSLKHHIYRPLKTISTVSWSLNGQWLASTSNNDERVVVHYVEKHSPLPFELKPTIRQTGVRFYNTSSRCLITWSNVNPTIMLWDLKNRNVKKLLNTSIADGINCALCNHADTHVACGSVEGKIEVINVATSVSLSPMTAPNIQGISALEYNRHHRNLLGAVSEDGSCNMWDCNTAKLIHSLPGVHASPATGLSFSPVNELLFATVGLDKLILFHDSQSKSTVLKINVEAPLASVDFLTDGSSICVGSTRGAVFIYDVRSPSVPLSSSVAHRMSVQAICVKQSSKMSEKDVFVVSNDYIHASKKASFSPKTEKSVMNMKIDESTIFSPVQDSEVCTLSGIPVSEYLQQRVITDASVIFSPAQEDNENFKSLTRLTTADSLDCNTHEASTNRAPSCCSGRSELFKSKTESLECNSASGHLEGMNVEVPSTIVHRHSADDVANHLELKASDDHEAEPGCASFIENVDELGKGNLAALYNTLTVALQSVRDSFHEDINNLHVDMIKGFFSQQLMIEELSRRCGALAAEMLILKRENETLRRQQ